MSWKVGKKMQKHRKKILGVVILVLVFAMFFGVRSIANSVRTDYQCGSPISEGGI